MYYKKIVGEHLYLSPMDIDHEVETMTKWLNEDEEIAYFNGFYGSLLGKEKIADMMMKWNEGPYTFSIVSCDEDEFMGHVSLFNLDAHEQYATMGIYIGKEYRHNGYGQEAIRLLKEYAFNVRRFNALHLEVFDFNPHAIKTYEKLGFVRCGIWHESRYHLGKSHDIVLMELLRDEKGTANN